MSYIFKINLVRSCFTSLFDRVSFGWMYPRIRICCLLYSGCSLNISLILVKKFTYRPISLVHFLWRGTLCVNFILKNGAQYFNTFCCFLKCNPSTYFIHKATIYFWIEIEFNKFLFDSFSETNLVSSVICYAIQMKRTF